jgi:hypothetical protein
LLVWNNISDFDPALDNGNFRRLLNSARLSAAVTIISLVVALTLLAMIDEAHARQGDLSKAFRTRVDSVLDTLDESFAHKLDAVNIATDPTARA